ncbi:alpha/beta hydrolase family protein [Plebeiibacterium marinum]|uniref:Alpha/beta hydrolase n=1 Tax=Plebeiibacterium marinum TaxID=2992111 RepID=A0AAE3SKY4_9BACT|nr:alpha/beta fold hydrolase [Plebeiobacterium marinum]MCW3807127.1 alpha/beta hydrolase [Plebeiobacterium marinum]
MKNLLILLTIIGSLYNVKGQTIISDSIVCVSDSLCLKGTLSYPESGKKLPAVIIISGTGKQDRDGSFAEHKPFFEIAQCLNNAGFAVLRMDDRGVGESEGVYEDATTMDFVSDVKAEIELLKKHPNIDKDKIGLIGHSEGGAVAFILASSNKDVKFMVSLAGLAVDGYTSLILQNRAILENSKYVKPQDVDLYMNLYTCMFKAVKNTPLEKDIEPVLDSVFTIWKTEQSEENLIAMHMNDGRDQGFLYRYKNIAKKAWYRQMIRYNPEEFISNIKIPVLALNGDKDIMVTPEENLNNIERLLKKANNKNFKTVLLPDHNHMFQHCEECSQAEIPNLPEAISGETLDAMSAWLRRNVN